MECEKERCNFMDRRCNDCMQMKKQGWTCESCVLDGQQENRPHQLPLGTMLQDRYRIGKVLGQGGFGITYVGWDAMLEKPVALKEYYPTGVVVRDSRSSLYVRSINEEGERIFRHSLERFLKEAKMLAKLRTVPGIVQVQSVFRENNTAYIVMEYLQGVDLKQYLLARGTPMSTDEMFAIMRPVIYTLSKVHEAKLVHRDVAPDNIFILQDGTTKLLDFGSARDIENAALGQNLPESTIAIVKQGFAPIEQYNRRGHLGSWTDIYSLCATMYYCLTGKVPTNVLDRLNGQDAVNWHQIPGLTESQIAVLERGLAIRPEDRIQTAGELWQGLFEQAKTDTTHEDGPKKPKKFVKSTSNMFFGCDKLPLEYKKIGGKHVWS